MIHTGLVALLRLCVHGSTRYTGEQGGTHTMFQGFATGRPFTQQGLSDQIVGTLGFILGPGRAAHAACPGGEAPVCHQLLSLISGGGHQQ